MLYSSCLAIIYERRKQKEFEPNSLSSVLHPMGEKFMNRHPSMKKVFAQKVGRLLLSAIFSLVFFSASVSQGQINAYWDVNGVTNGQGGTGTWNSTQVVWTTNSVNADANSGGPTGGGLFAVTNGAAAGQSGNYIFNFGGTAGTINQGGSFQAYGVNFLAPNYNWAIDATGTNVRTITTTNAISLGANSLTLQNGSRGLNAFTFAGPTSSTGLGITGTSGSSLTLRNLFADSTSNSFGVFVSGGGTISSNIPINVDIGAGSKISLGSQSSGGATFNSAITLNTNASGVALNIVNSTSGVVAMNGVISGVNGLILENSGSGKIVLTAANTYSGGTTVINTNGGEVQYSNVAAFGSGTITSSSAGTNYMRALASGITITNAISLDANNTLRVGTTTNTGWSLGYSGVISGSGSLLYSLSGILTLSSSNSSFGGGFALGSSGQVNLSKIGMAGQNSSIGTNGVIMLGLITTPSSQPKIRWNGTANETSDKVINIGNATGGLELSTLGDGDLTLNGNINSSGLGGPKTILIYPYTNSSMVVNGVTNIVTNTLSLNGVINDGTQGYVVNDASISSKTVITNVVGGVTNTQTNTGVSTITLASVSGVSSGASISGGNCIAPGTTIIAVDTATKVITLSQNTTNTNSISAGLALMNVAGATAATSLTIQPKSSAGSSYVNVVLGSPSNSFSGGVLFTNAQSGLVSLLKISKFGNPGENSSLGTAGNFTFGGASGSTCTLDYNGSGEVSSKTITLGGSLGNVGLSQSGTGLLKLTGSILPGTTTGARKLTLSGSTLGSAELSSNLGDISGFALSVDKNGTGTWTLSGNNSYTGNTAINSGALRLSGVNTIPGTVTLGAVSSALLLAHTNALSNGTLLGASGSTNTGTLNLEVGGNHSISSYGNSGNAGGYMNFTNSSGSDATLFFTTPTNYISLSSSTTGGRSLTNQSANLTLVFNGAVDIGSSVTADVTFAGSGHYIILGSVFNTNPLGVRALTKSGAGALTLSASNNYNGVTTISAGSLILKAEASLGTNSLILSGGTLKVDNSGTNESKGNLSLSGNSTIDLGTANTAVLRFATATGWTVGKTLTVTNSSGGGKLYISDTNTTVTNQIKSAENPAAVASLGSDGLVTFSVAKTNQTITFGPLAAVKVGDAPITLGATASSGLTVSYVSSDSTVASVLGNIVTILKAGTTTITASQSGDGSYNSAQSVSQTLTVTSAGPTFSDAYKNNSLTDVAPNGLTYLVNYAFGGSDSSSPILPVQDTSDTNKLTLVAYVRTGDSSLSVLGEVSGGLHAFDSVNTIPGEVVSPSDAPVGMEKRKYSVSVSGDRKFLRLRVTKQ